jgi:hypothetical protein
MPIIIRQRNKQLVCRSVCYRHARMLAGNTATRIRPDVLSCALVCQMDPLVRLGMLPGEVTRSPSRAALRGCHGIETRATLCRR